jgi:hypothetical protein
MLFALLTGYFPVGQLVKRQQTDRIRHEPRALRSARSKEAFSA